MLSNNCVQQYILSIPLSVYHPVCLDKTLLSWVFRTVFSWVWSGLNFSLLCPNNYRALFWNLLFRLNLWLTTYRWS